MWRFLSLWLAKWAKHTQRSTSLVCCCGIVLLLLILFSFCPLHSPLHKQYCGRVIIDRFTSEITQHPSPQSLLLHWLRLGCLLGPSERGAWATLRRGHSNWLKEVTTCTCAVLSLIDRRREGNLAYPSAEAACSRHFVIMICRPMLIRDVKVIMVQGGRPCKGALGLVLLAAPEQENEYISLRPSNFINTYFIHCVMDIKSLHAALTGGHRSSVAKVPQKEFSIFFFFLLIYNCEQTRILIETAQNVGLGRSWRNCAGGLKRAPLLQRFHPKLETGKCRINRFLRQTRLKFFLGVLLTSV